MVRAQEPSRRAGHPPTGRAFMALQRRGKARHEERGKGDRVSGRCQFLLSLRGRHVGEGCLWAWLALWLESRRQEWGRLGGSSASPAKVGTSRAGEMCRTRSSWATRPYACCLWHWPGVARPWRRLRWCSTPQAVTEDDVRAIPEVQVSSCCLLSDQCLWNWTALINLSLRYFSALTVLPRWPPSLDRRVWEFAWSFFFTQLGTGGDWRLKLIFVDAHEGHMIKHLPLGFQ